VRSLGADAPARPRLRHRHGDFNRREPALAADKKASYLDRYKRPGAPAAWHFLTGDEAAIRVLTDAVGFHYVFDPRLNQFAHPAGIMIATPEGRLSKYLYGIDYAPRDIRLALVQPRITGSAARSIGCCLCYHHDPAAGSTAWPCSVWSAWAAC
jgi:protein SCO1/2